MVNDYHFNSRREFRSVTNMDFFFVKVSFILSRLELSRAEFPKLTPSVLMENCDHAICPGLSVLFLHVPTPRAWLFEKLILELEGPSCSLKSLIFTSRPGWSRTNNPFVWLSPGEKKIGTTSYSLSGVFDNGWYEFRLKYWCPCFVFCKIQVLHFASKDPWYHQRWHILCCNLKRKK